MHCGGISPFTSTEINPKFQVVVGTSKRLLSFSNDKVRRLKLTAVEITALHLSYRPHYLTSINAMWNSRIFEFFALVTCV